MTVKCLYKAPFNTSFTLVPPIWIIIIQVIYFASSELDKLLPFELYHRIFFYFNGVENKYFVRVCVCGGGGCQNLSLPIVWVYYSSIAYRYNSKKCKYTVVFQLF